MARRLITVATGTGVSTFTWGDNGLVGPASSRTYNASGGSGSGARFTVVRSGGGTNSPITAVNLSAAGSGYAINNVLTVNENVAPNDTITITVTGLA